MRPYYEHAGITIYHGDAREVLPHIRADVLVTDPPYGVGLGIGKDMRGDGHGLAKGAYEEYEDSLENLVCVVAPILRASIEATKRGAAFSGPHLQEMPKASAIGGVYCPAATGRHSWGFKSFLPVLFFGTDPLLNKGARPNVIVDSSVAEKNGHPCPKPLAWMNWLVARVALPGETILDPFMGSGTTLVAAKNHGHPAIGIERTEAYCEIAAKRLAQDSLFAGTTEQPGRIPVGREG